jgi:kynureninase
VLSLAALQDGLELVGRVGVARLRERSRDLGDLLIHLIEQECGGHGLTLVSPIDAERRGSQVSYSHPEGYAIMQALIARGVVGDFRAPDLLRFGLSPLCLRFVDLWDAAAHLRAVLEDEEWRRPEHRRRASVT